MSWTKLALACSPLFLVACQSFLSFDRERVAIEPDAGAAADARVDAPPPDTSPDGDAATATIGIFDAGSDGRTYGPTMVHVVADETTGDGFLVDSTEVTRGQFAQYLRATNDGALVADPAIPARCVSRASFAAGKSADCTFTDGPALEAEPSLPMSCVDWCTAWAFCRWSGKRLCGARGTGARVPLDKTDDVGVSEWFLACGTRDQHRFPYGDDYAAAACATESAAIHDVGLSSCAGNETGPFDMSGNVAEWENGCSDDGAQCAVRGGDHAAPSSSLECARKTAPLPTETFRPTLGFRCCADTTTNMPDPDAGEP